MDVHPAKYVDEVSEHCEVCRAFDEAPHAPIAGIFAVSMFSEKLSADLLFWGDLVALRAMDFFPNDLLPILARPQYPQEAWGASWSARNGGLRQPKRI